MNSPNGVVPGSNFGKPPPKSGEPPYLAVGAALLSGVALVAERGVLRQ